MIAVILKELRQTAHHAWVTGFAVLLAFSGIALIAGKLRGSVPAAPVFFFHAGVLVFCVVLVALAAHRWKRERGDTALDMSLTTALPFSAIVFGKFLAIYLAMLGFLLLDRAVDFPLCRTEFFWKKFVTDAAGFAALASLIPALASLRTQRGSGFEWSGVLAFFFALPIIGQHGLMFLHENGILISPDLIEAPLFRVLTLSLGFAILGFLIAFAGLKKPGSDRMRDLHGFVLVMSLTLPLLAWYFGDESWAENQSRMLMTAAKLFLLASLFERGAVTTRQKKTWRFPLLATGSGFVWGWSLVLAAAACLVAPHPETIHLELGNWCFLGVYVALARGFRENRSVLRRAFGLLIVMIAASAAGCFALLEPKLAWLSPIYFDFFAFSWRFFGIVFALSILLRIREMVRFIRSFRA